jgi:ribosome-binding ATPase YchF (GTP1/OBG family)
MIFFLVLFHAPSKQYDSMSAEDRATLLAEKKLKSMLPKIIKTGYEALQLIQFFTAGHDEVRFTLCYVFEILSVA